MECAKIQKNIDLLKYSIISNPTKQPNKGDANCIRLKSGKADYEFSIIAGLQNSKSSPTHL